MGSWPDTDIDPRNLKKSSKLANHTAVFKLALRFPFQHELPPGIIFFSIDLYRILSTLLKRYQH